MGHTLMVCICKMVLLLSACRLSSSYLLRVASIRGKIQHFGSSRESAPFLDALVAARAEVKEGYFFPGHQAGKRSHMPREMQAVYGTDNKVFSLDLPELGGLGNIHSTNGGEEDETLCIALRQAACLFDAHCTWFLVNGSTGGILAGKRVILILKRPAILLGRWGRI